MFTYKETINPRVFVDIKRHVYLLAYLLTYLLTYKETINRRVYQFSFSSQSTLVRSGGTSLSISGYNSFNGTLSPGSMHSLSFEGSMESSLANSPPVPSKEAFQYLYRPKNFAEKARINCA